MVDLCVICPDVFGPMKNHRPGRDEDIRDSQQDRQTSAFAPAQI